MKDKKGLWRSFFYYGGILVGMTLFLYQLLQGLQGFRDQPIGPSQMPYVGAAVVALLVAYALQMLAYACLLRGLGVHIPMVEVFGYYVLSFLPRYIPGTVWGYLGRSEWLRMRFGVSYSTSGLSSVLEAGVGLLTALTVGGVSYLWAMASSPLRWVSIPAVPLICWLSWHIFASLSHLPLFRSLKRRLFNSDVGSKVALGYWLLACLIYYFFWLCYGSALSLLLQASAQRSVGLLQSTFVYSVAWTVGFLILIVPSGLGARETMLSLLLVRQFQLSAHSAGAIAIACRIVVYVAELLWLLVGWLLMRLTAKGKSEQVENHLP
ncbi:MAG: lysylphosphatidylglycerol synthase domain-containing protein [Anaerolineae bacterium]